VNGLFQATRVGFAGLDKPFLIVPGGPEIGFADVPARSAQVANALVQCGVAPGDRVAAQVEKSVDAVMIYLACLRVGACYLPLNPTYTPPEIEYFLRDSEPALFIVDPARSDAMRSVAENAGVPRTETLDDHGGGSFARLAAAAETAFDDRPTDAGTLASILYTSGTTGRPKGAMLSHGNLLSNASALVETWRINSADTLIHALPIFHTHGLFVALNTSLLAGVTVRLLPRFDLEAIVAALPDSTMLMGVPTFYARFVASPDLNRESTRHIRLFVSGSAPLSAETHAEFLAKTGHAILERYGMTETNMIASNPFDGERKAGTVGRPLPGVCLRIAEPSTGEILPDGDVGGIEVRGPNVFSGYWRNPEKTAESFRPDGYFITGDMGYVDGEGYVRIVGRSKDLIISGGFNVYPAEVETVLDAHPGVAESAVIGIPHPDFGEGVTAVVIPRPGVVLDEARVLAELGRSLARYKVPKRLLVVDALPRNAMGKIQKNVLRDTYAHLYTAKKVAV
jgi:malonyl-CoA/methylmalonyl-CoA synthetase